MAADCRAHADHRDRSGGVRLDELHAQRPTSEDCDALRLLDGADWRVCLHHCLAGSDAGRHQRLPLSGCSSGVGGHHIPHTLHDPCCRALLQPPFETSAEALAATPEPLGRDASLHAGRAQQLAQAAHADGRERGRLQYSLDGRHRTDVHHCTSLLPPPVVWWR